MGTVYIMNFQEYIKPELLILIPVLYFIGLAIKKSALQDKYIPLILGLISVLVSGIYLIASSEISNVQDFATALFTAITQGVLCAAASVYADQLIKQSLKRTDDETEKEKEE